MTRTVLLAAVIVLPLLGAPAGFVAISVDSMPSQVYFDATTVLLSDGPQVVEAEPGKHFVSLYPPAVVYRAAKEQAPIQFWERLRSLGAIGDEYGLLASYEAGAVRAGTNWIYVTPDETLAVALSHREADRVYRHDSGCATRTFLGWAALIGVGMILSVFVSAINPQREIERKQAGPHRGPASLSADSRYSVLMSRPVASTTPRSSLMRPT